MLFIPFGKKSHIFARVGLTLALVANLTLPAFASDLTSGSAFGVDERLFAVPRLSASASAPVGSSTDPYYVRPFNNGSATVYRYSWSRSNPNGSSSGTNQTFTNFADIVTHITNSIANSFLALGQRLHYDNDAIYGKLYDILTAIQAGVSSPLFWTDLFPAEGSNFWTGSFTNNYNMNHLDLLRVGGTSGTSFTTSIDNVPYFMGMKYLLSEFNNNMSYMAVRLTNHVHGSFPLYSMDDMTPSDIPDSLGSGSLWDTAIRGFSNLSYGLSKLVFVLANDDDIALRQSQHDNMQSLKNQFTSGDVSVSPAKLGGLKSVGSALTDGLSSSASVSDGLSVLGSDSDAWSWFSDENAQSFDSVSGSRNMRLLNSGSSYLDLYYKDVMPYVN